MSSNDLFLCEISLVLVVDSQFAEGSKFLLLDSLYFEAVLLELLADLTSFFEVVEPFLLFNF